MTSDAVELATIPNPWNKTRHHCYFCAPDDYPKMPPEHTLCARCGALIVTPGRDDPHNLAMAVCPPCDTELESDLRGSDQ